MMKRFSLLLALVFLLTPQNFAVDPVVSAAREYRRANEHRFLREFFELLAIPNVAADREQIRRNADYLMSELEKRGLEPQLLNTADGNAPPAVYGEWSVPNAKRTIVFYAHYDGQPTDPRAWAETAPWQPVLRTDALERGGRIIALPESGQPIDPLWRVYARSASDDKAGVFAILKAFDALRAAKIQPSVNLKFFFEGEEEAGSPHLQEIVTRHKSALKADAWIVCDGPVHQSGRKQVVFGVRGVTGVEITAYGANRALHSGHYGNWSPNPALTLARLLSSMKDETGRVLVKDWYADTEPLGELEKQAIKEAPQYDEELRKQLGLARTDGAGKTYLEMINLPSLNIIGIKSGDVGDAARNIIPSTAIAALDLRLVKGNDHLRQAEKLKAFIRQKGFYVIDRDPTEAERLAHPLIVKFRQTGGYNAQRTPMNLPISQSVVDAVQATSAEPIVKMPSLGGSLPLSIISDNLSVPAIIVPIANYDNNQHAENENIRLQNLWDGIEIFARLMTIEAK